MRQTSPSPTPDDRSKSATSGPDDQTQGLHGEDQPHEAATVLAVRVLTHVDGGDGIVAADAEPEDKSGGDKEEKAGAKAEPTAPRIMMTATVT